MVIGNTHGFSASLLAPGSTLASTIASEFDEAVGGLYPSVLYEMGLVLLLVTIVTNILARLLLGAVRGREHA